MRMRRSFWIFCFSSSSLRICRFTSSRFSLRSSIPAPRASCQGLCCLTGCPLDQGLCKGTLSDQAPRHFWISQRTSSPTPPHSAHRIQLPTTPASAHATRGTHTPPPPPLLLSPSSCPQDYGPPRRPSPTVTSTPASVPTRWLLHDGGWGAHFTSSLL